MGAARPELTSEERAALQRLSAWLWDFGTANDADDHAAGAEAVQLRLDAAAGIRDLLRERPFVAALFPRLGAELESGHLETLGWSRLADSVDELLGTVRVETIPWDRVYHLRGRATEVPDWIAELATDSHAAAERRLRQCLVDGDRITQATPLAMRLILGALRFGLVRDANAVREMAELADAAAGVQLAARGPAGERPTLADWSVYPEERLWPRFVDAREDEALRGRWKPTDEEVLGWASLTRQVLEEHARRSKPLDRGAPRD